MVSYRTVFPLLTLILSVSIAVTTGRRQCAELVDDPSSVFSQSKDHTEPLAEYLATDLVACMDICCDDEISCNVGVFVDSSTSDTNCWLYSCFPLDSCALKLRRGAEYFVNPRSSDAENASDNPDNYTPSYGYNFVDYSNYDGYDGDTTTHNNDETYYTDDDTSNTFSTLESTTISTPPSITTELSPVTESESVPESTSVSLAGENNTFVSLPNESVFQNDTYRTPDNEGIFKNDTFTTIDNEDIFKNYTFTTPNNEDILQNDTVATPLNEANWENNTSAANISKEIQENSTIAPSFTKENNSFFEDKYNIKDVSVWPVNIIASSDSSSSFSTPRVDLPQTPDTSYQTNYNNQSTGPSEDSTLIRPTNTTLYNNAPQETPVFSSSDWSTVVFSTSIQVGSTAGFSELEELGSLVLLESVMAGSAGGDDSSSPAVTGEGFTNLYESTQTFPVVQQSVTMTADIFPPSDLWPQDSHNDTESRADIDYQPSEAATGLLISALTVGCVCAVAVVSVLSFRLYDGYKKRHYSRLDYLINGIYN